MNTTLLLALHPIALSLLIMILSEIEKTKSQTKNQLLL